MTGTAAHRVRMHNGLDLASHGRCNVIAWIKRKIQRWIVGDVSATPIATIDDQTASLVRCLLQRVLLKLTPEVGHQGSLQTAGCQ